VPITREAKSGEQHRRQSCWMTSKKEFIEFVWPSI
jgi:hypothetical protein